MSYTNNYLITTILIIITTVYLLNIPRKAISMENDIELGYICLSSEPTNIAYIQNRDSVMNDLKHNTSLLDGYSVAIYSSSHDDESDDSVFGHALCRGDVSADDCKICVQNATENDPCIGSRSGTIWREYCMVKYSDVNFLETIDTNAFHWKNKSDWMNPDSSVKVTKKLMDSAYRAAISDNITMYGNVTTYLEENGIGYTWLGMTQCTRDLSISDCQACLYSAINNLNIKKQSGGVVCGSCYARFEQI